MSLDTFAEVAKHYAETRPMISCNHTKEDDIRPLGKRRCKWRRIARVSDREYILYDMLPYHHRNPYVAKALDCPPITWKRKGKRERVTVRGATTPAHDTSRYNFLREWLPLGLRFDNWSKLGVHYVHVFDMGHRGAVDGKKYYLPRPIDRNDNRDYFLTFEKDEPIGDWELVSHKYEIPKVRVNQRKKAAAKEHIASFYRWLCAIGPVLPAENWEYKNKLRNEVRDYVTNLAADNILKSKVQPVPYNNGGRVIPPKLALEIMKNYNHPLRIHLACNFLANLRGEFDTTTQFRAAFNKWTNKVLDFNQTIRK